MTACTYSTYIVCVCACVRACMRACACVCVCVHAYISVCVCHVCKFSHFVLCVFFQVPEIHLGSSHLSLIGDQGPRRVYTTSFQSETLRTDPGYTTCCFPQGSRRVGSKVKNTSHRLRDGTGHTSPQTCEKSLHMNKVDKVPTFKQIFLKYSNIENPHVHMHNMTTKDTALYLILS